MKDPLVSVIIPTCNRRLMLNNAIASVVAQSFGDWELIVVDDGSTDGSAAVAGEWVKRDSRIRCEVTKAPSGGSAARNIAINLARGEFIAFLDDDDSWRPAKLSEQVAALKRTPDAVAASCWYALRCGRGIKTVKTAVDPGLQSVLSDNVLGGASVCMVRRAVLAKSGGFAENLPSCQDWDFWVRLRRQGPVVTVRAVLADYGVHRMARYRRICKKDIPDSAVSI
jgi:glycosyltransferase involved in cell wall biosynthesis